MTIDGFLHDRTTNSFDHYFPSTFFASYFFFSCVFSVSEKLEHFLTLFFFVISHVEFLDYRKRSLSDSPNDDLDNTRDSLLSEHSQCFSDASTEPELMIIDFEYCAYNYRGFDLANHFIEWTFDYTNKEYPYFYHKREQYPNQEQQVRRRLFLRGFLFVENSFGMFNNPVSCLCDSYRLGTAFQRIFG